MVIFTLMISWAYAVEITQPEDPRETPNMYERIETLSDSLKSWSQVVPVENASTLGEDFRIDSTVLADWFPGSIVRINDSLKTALISYPKYMDLFTTHLQFDYNDITIDSNTVRWSAPLQIIDQAIVLDSTAIPTPENVVCNSQLEGILQNRITALRIIGLPEGIRADWNARCTNEFNVTVRGRDIIEIPFYQGNLIYALHQIAFGMQVYSGLLSITGSNDTLNMNFYILITFPDANGHHFIEVTEQVIKSEEGWKTSGMEVIFTPYIRTDNLKNLFATPDSKQQDPIQLRIR